MKFKVRKIYQYGEVSTLPKFAVDADQVSKIITISKQGDALHVERIVLSRADRLNLTTEATSIEASPTDEEAYD